MDMKGHPRFNEGDFILKNPDVEERKRRCKKALEKHPDKIPCIVEYTSDFPEANRWKKTKFLVHRGNTLGVFMNYIRVGMSVEPSEGVFLLINNSMPKLSDDLGSIYERHKKDDDMVYFVVSKENVFG